MAGETVSAFMEREVVSLTESDTLRSAVELVLARRVRHIPVVDGDGAVIGILTDRDVKRALPTVLLETSEENYQRLLDETLVTRVMTRDPLTVAPDTPLGEAVRIMVEKSVGGLPVVEGRRLVGIITQTDALRVLLRLLGVAPT